MNLRMPLIVSAAVVAAMLAASALAVHLLPAGAAIPIHWNIDGQPDRYARGWYAVFMLPAMTALIATVFAAIPKLEPRRLNLESSAKFYRATWMAVLLLMAAMHGLALASAIHPGLQTGGIVIGGVSLMMVVIGNYLGKTRSMFLGGVRTPWTLSSEYSWGRTHSLTGKMFIAAGVSGLAAAILLPAHDAARIFAISMFAAIIVGVAASYMFWLRDPERHRDDAEVQ